MKAKYGDLLTGHGTKRPKLPKVQSQRGNYTAFGQCHWLGPFLHRTPTFCRPDNLTVPASIPFYRVNPSTIPRVWPRCGGLKAGGLLSVTDLPSDHTLPRYPRRLTCLNQNIATAESHTLSTSSNYSQLDCCYGRMPKATYRRVVHCVIIACPLTSLVIMH